MAGGSTQLDGFRGPEVELDPADRVPTLTPDNPDPGPAPAATIVREATPPAPANDDPPPEPSLVTDPRAAMARRFQERRQREHDSAQNVDPFAAPVEAHVPGAPQNDNLTAPPAANDDLAAPAASNDNPATYELKVNRQSFTASRAQLLSAAEFSEDEAAGLPDSALIRIAQKNLAAQQRLEEVRLREQESRLTALVSPATPGPQPSQVENQPTPAAPPADELDLVQKIQLGDTDEALNAWNELADRREARKQAQLVGERLRNDLNTALRDFGRDNPDIANDQFAADALRIQSVREAVTELKRIVSMSDHEEAQLLNNQEMTAIAYNNALKQGYQIADHRALFDRAGGVVRSKLGMAPGGIAPQNFQPAPSNPRLEMKRALPTQPARSGSPSLSAHSSQPVAPQRNSSDVIASMRKARFQD